MTELKEDLFKQYEFLKLAEEECIIVHCISSDKAMGAGIALPMQNKFKLRENWPSKLPERLKGWAGEGYSVFVTGEEKQIVCNLITKEHYYDKPTLETFKQALNDAKYTLDELSQIGFNVPNKILMPKIGCGLDRLNWNDVKPLIELFFKGYDITVCYL